MANHDAALPYFHWEYADSRHLTPTDEFDVVPPVRARSSYAMMMEDLRRGPLQLVLLPIFPRVAPAVSI